MQFDSCNGELQLALLVLGAGFFLPFFELDKANGKSLPASPWCSQGLRCVK